MATDDRPLILVCNDDGIFSPGIKALAEVASEFARVAIIAPDRQQSAVGHAITVNLPLRSRSFRVDGRFDGQAVSGTPADAVKLAHNQLLDRKPDLVVRHQPRIQRRHQHPLLRHRQRGHRRHDPGNPIYRRELPGFR